MNTRWSIALSLALTLGFTTISYRSAAQDLVIHHVDGTVETVTSEAASPRIEIKEDYRFEPSLGSATYLNIAVDMANMTLADTLEYMQGTTDPGYVDEIFKMVAGTGPYEGIVASYLYDSYGAFCLESEFMGVYQSVRVLEPPCGAGFFESIALELWPLVQRDAEARDIDLEAYDGLVWWYPFLGTCSVSAFAYLGPTDHLFGHPYRLVFIAFPAAYMLKHEIGHTRGLGHLNCFFDNGDVDVMCEGGNMGFPGWFLTPEGEPRSTHENDLIKTSANHQFLLGWTDPNGGAESAHLADDTVGRSVIPRPDPPESTFVEVTRTGVYRLSAHRGPASENEHPELLVIPGDEEYKYWFISFEEGDGYNPTLHEYFTIAQKKEKVTVRYQFVYPDRPSNSFRMGLLGVGECIVIDDDIEVCNEALYGSEEADVGIWFPGWRIRHPSGRVPLPNP